MEQLFAVIAYGVIIIIVAALAYRVGRRTGEPDQAEEYKSTSLSLRGLSPRSVEIMKQTHERVWVWEENRGPNKHLYRKVHYD